MYKDKISKVVHNRDIKAAKEAGWTLNPETATIKTNIKPTAKNKVSIGEVDVIEATINNDDLLGPKDLDKEGD
jgi:ferredoxin-thioredoxin reductase catalytic subunit